MWDNPHPLHIQAYLCVEAERSLVIHNSDLSKKRCGNNKMAFLPPSLSLFPLFLSWRRIDSCFLELRAAEEDGRRREIHPLSSILLLYLTWIGTTVVSLFQFSSSCLPASSLSPSLLLHAGWYGFRQYAINLLKCYDRPSFRGKSGENC